MIVSITHNKIKHSAVISEDATKGDVLRVTQRLMMCVGYSFSDTEAQDILTACEDIIKG